MATGTDATPNTTTDKGTDKTAPPAKGAVDTNHPDVIDSLKKAVQIGRDGKQIQTASLSNPDTAQLFKTTQGTEKPPGLDKPQGGDKTNGSESVLQIQPLFSDKGVPGIYKDAVGNKGGSGSDSSANKAGDKQVLSGPWDTINKSLQFDSGPMHFDNVSAPIRFDASDLVKQFQQEQKSGKLDGDSAWQKYLQSRSEASGTDVKPLLETFKKEHGQTALTDLLEKSSKGSLDEKQKEQLRQLENDPSWKRFVEQYENKKLQQSGPDVETVKRVLEGNPTVTDGLKTKDAAKQNDVATEHQHLSDWADKNLHEPELSKYKKDMADFEDRAKRDGLSQDEILKTYQQIERINAGTGDKPLSQLERQHISQEVMHQAAVPTDISQGYHNTCNVTSIECRTYTRDPAAAAKLVADVALTGEYHAPDGTVVKINPAAHDQSKTWPPVDGQRTHASELFEVTAVNIHYAQENAKNGTDIRYEQQDPKPGDNADTGERLMDYSKHPPKNVTEGGGWFGWGGTEVHSPDLTDKAITDVSNTITGKNEKDVLLQAWGTTDGGVTAVHSEDELKAKLKELKDQHKLPVVIFVDTNNEPFYSDSGRGAAGGSGGPHVVTITDYDEKTGQVCVDNQWNSAVDHGKNNPINVHDLYTAMQFPADAEKTLKNDVDYNKAHGIYDPQKEADLIRHQLAAKEIDPAKAEEETKKIMAEMSKHWQDTNAPMSERQSEWREVEAIIHQLPVDSQMRLAKEAHDDHLITDAWYKEELRVAAYQMVHENDQASRFLGYNPWADGEYARQQQELKKAMADLSPDDQRDLLNQIADYIRRKV